MICEYTLIRSRRKSVSIQVDGDCNITVRAPLKLSQEEIDEILLKKKEWLEKAIISQQERKKDIKEYTDSDIELLREKAKEILPDKVKYYAEIMQKTNTHISMYIVVKHKK